MIDMTPETAVASRLAIRIARRVLSLDGMTVVRDLLSEPGGDLPAFAAFIARQIDIELDDPGEAKQALGNLLHAYDELVECAHLAKWKVAYYGHNPAAAAARAIVADTAPA